MNGPDNVHARVSLYIVLDLGGIPIILHTSNKGGGGVKFQDVITSLKGLTHTINNLELIISAANYH